MLAVAVCGQWSCREQAGDGSADGGALPIVKTATGVEMVRVPAGAFVMGSADGPANERPAHKVHVDAFLIDRTEVTQAQFRKMEIPDPSHFKSPDEPVEQVGIGEIIDYCNERSLAEGLTPCYTVGDDGLAWRCDFSADGYRLPTEAEWEYACRAGTDGDAYHGDARGETAVNAWYAENSGKRTHPVAKKRANPWGLFDMYGNVSEWCNDRYAADSYSPGEQHDPRGPDDGDLLTIRGGAWDSPPEQCRSAWRAGQSPRLHDICFAKDTIGFRCVRSVPAP
jgi:formylglycine-generating enzyme required for sulfatase activity